jgi:2,4-dichlorophenol 6-monooxygenase
VDAAQRAAAEFGVGVAAFVIGPGADYLDIYGDWARLSEIEDSGCVLLRPDNYVCFRAVGLAGAQPASALREALRRVLGR